MVKICFALKNQIFLDYNFLEMRVYHMELYCLQLEDVSTDGLVAEGRDFRNGVFISYFIFLLFQRCDNSCL